VTETDWLACTDPMPMVGFVLSKASDRKFRLLSVAACRHVWGLLEDERSRQGIEVAELHADGQVDDEKLDAALMAASDAYNDAEDRQDLSSEARAARCDLAQAVESVTQPRTEAGVAYRGWEALSMIARAVAIIRPDSVVERVPFPEGDMIFESGAVYTEALSLDEQAAQADMIRDIFGNPFRPVTVDPTWIAWNDSTVVKLAQGIYDDRAFERLPVLADALEEAGCHNADILAHCRGPSEHVRGCWAVDLLLGKE
jgi:hypothetical protein